MKGDFSRGFDPDRKRGKDYRRVLLQQRRLLLDSDLAAMTDAQDGLLRRAAMDTGGTGSPDLGFLITPGKLLAVFENLDHVEPDNEVEVVRDYGRKYQDRFPSLRVDNQSEFDRGVTIRLKDELAAGSQSLVLWVRTNANLSIQVAAGDDDAETALVSADTVFQRVTVSLTVTAATTNLRVVLPSSSSEPVWLGLVEMVEDTATGPFFWVAPGRYYRDGLMVELPQHQGYPEVSFPAAAGFDVDDVSGLAADTRVLAYLDAWERAITHVEDPGIREQALGGQDSTLRTQALGQVKIVAAGALTADALRHAFLDQAPDTGRLDISVQPETSSADPCALPISGGYTGPDNRLYWFEVHTGGDLGSAVLKWSRDNAAEVYAVDAVADSVITLAHGSDLRDSDIVEVLNEVIDLGDAAPASFDGEDRLVPPTPMVGELAQLVALAADEEGRARFRLATLDDPNTDVVLSSDAVRYGDGTRVTKVRRWHGVIDTGPGQGLPDYEIDIEDGIVLTLSGSFRVGAYWQYEARSGGDNANGAWQPAAHGPARERVPLAVLIKPAAGTDPLALETWLDTRFQPLATLDADHVAFADERFLRGAPTVQDAIEALIVRESVQAVKVGAQGSEVLVAEGANVQASALASGVLVDAGTGVDLSPASEATYRVTLELPFPHSHGEQNMWGPDFIGTRPVCLDGTVSAAAASARWQPSAAAQQWLSDRFAPQWALEGLGGAASDWRYGSQGELVQSATGSQLAPGSTHTGFVARHLAPMQGDTASVVFRWTDASEPHRQIGLVYDWQDAINYSMVLYEQEELSYTSGTETQHVLEAKLRQFTVSGGNVPQFYSFSKALLFHASATALPSSWRTSPYRMTVGPEGFAIECLATDAGPLVLLRDNTAAVQIDLTGSTVGVFTHLATELQQMDDLNGPEEPVLVPVAYANPVRARVSLQRKGVRWAGGGPSVPFHKDFEHWFWVTP